HHTGMYIGNGMMIHAPHTGDVVKVSSLKEPYYQEQLFAARRIAPADPNAVLAPPGPEAVSQAGAPSPAGVAGGGGAPPPGGGPRNPVQSRPAIAREQQEKVAQPAPVQEAAPADAVPADAADAASAVSDAYPGEGASREQLAAWMGDQAEKAGLP